MLPFTGPPLAPRWRRTGPVCLAAAVLLVAGGLLALNDPAPALPADATLAPQMATDGPPLTAALPVATSPPGPRPAAPGMRSAEASPVEVCGHGWVQLPADDPNPLQRLPPGVRAATLDQAEARLLADPRPSVQAAALMVVAHARGPGGRARVQQLARLAMASQEEPVYTLALQACGRYAEAPVGACLLLNRARLAQLAPDNLHPWLALAAEADARDDEAAEADAMRRAARASRAEGHADLPAQLLAPALRPPVPALQRALLLSLAHSIGDGWRLTQANHADRHCSAEALQADAGRAPVCDAVARTLVEQGRSVADIGSGLTIGAALGWPEARLAVGREAQALLALRAESAMLRAANGLDFSCALESTTGRSRVEPAPAGGGGGAVPTPGGGHQLKGE